jgi:Flp pilus assembly pilin Flp
VHIESDRNGSDTGSNEFPSLGSKSYETKGTAMTLINNFLRDEQGQDLIEYTLLLAFVALASAALFLGAGNSVKGIWSTTNSQLAAANSSAS